VRSVNREYSEAKVIHLENYIVETVELVVCERRQNRGNAMRVAEGSPGARTLLSVRGTVWKAGDPAITDGGRIGDLKRGKTGAIGLKGVRGSDFLIVAKKLAKGRPERVEPRGEPSRELV